MVTRKHLTREAKQGWRSQRRFHREVQDASEPCEGADQGLHDQEYFEHNHRSRRGRWPAGTSDPG